METADAQTDWVYWKPEEAERTWLPIPNTDAARHSAIAQGAMFFTWASVSEPYTGNGQPEPVRKGDFPVDTDCKDHPEKALDDVRRLCLEYLPEFYRVDPYAIRYFATGSKGFHAEIPAVFFGAQDGDPYLHLIFKRIACDWAVRFGLATSDLSLFAGGKGKMWRIPNIQRSNGRYKVPLTLEELRDLSIESLMDLTKSPRAVELVEVDLVPNEDLVRLYQEAKAAVYSELEHHKEVTPLSEEERERLGHQIPPCIEHILAEMPAKTDRINFNQLVLLLATYFHLAGCDESTAWAQVEWFIDHYPHSETYDTPAKRLKHWKAQWLYLAGNDQYTFDCAYVLGLKLPGSAFECKDCIKMQGPGGVESTTAAWEPPTNLRRGIPPAPRFPLEVLPYRVANYAQDEAERMQSPIDLIAIPILVTLAGQIGKNAAMRPKARDDWSERPCLWAVVIAPVASLKSQNITKATAPLRMLQKKLAEQDAEIISDWKALDAVAEAKEAAWKKACQNLLKGDPAAELPPVPEEVANLPPKPRTQRVLTNDATIEKLADLMTTSRGLTLLRDEISGWFENMSRYNSGSDRQFFLECHAGGSYCIDRVTRGEQFIDDLYLNIVGGTQPDVASAIFAGDNAKKDGFAERFGLITYPERMTTYTHVDRWPDKDMKASFNDLCARLADADWAEVLNADKFGDVPFVRFDRDAQEIFDSWITEHMQLIRTMDDNPLTGFMGKARGLLVRLTLILHLAAWAGGEISDPKTSTERSLTRALRLLEDYLIPMWQRVIAAFAETPASQGADRIAKYIRENRLTQIRVRDVVQKEWQGLTTKESVEVALRCLVNDGWLGEPTMASKGGSKGGRPTLTYPVNPLVLTDEHPTKGQGLEVTINAPEPPTETVAPAPSNSTASIYDLNLAPRQRGG